MTKTLNPEANTQLIASVTAQDVFGAIAALDAGADVQCTALVERGNRDNAALWIATENSDATMVAYLLKRGANPNASYEYRMGDDTYAAEVPVRKGRLDILEMYIAVGLAPHVLLQLSQTAYRDQKELSDRLYCLFSDWSNRRYDNYISVTIFRTGIMRDRIQDALARGVNPDAIFGEAVRTKNFKIARELLNGDVRRSLERVPSDAIQRFGALLHPIYYADWFEGLREFTAVVKTIHGTTDTNITDALTDFLNRQLDFGTPPRLTNTIEEIVTLGAAVDRLDLGERPFQTFSPPLLAYLLTHGLHIPEAMGFESLIGFGKLSRGSSINTFERVKDHFRLTPKEWNEALIVAAEQTIAIPIEWLLEQGADTRAGESAALRMASLVGNTSAVRTLLAAGADRHADDDYALRIATEKGHQEVISLLVA